MHTNTEFYDLTNAAVIGWTAAVKRCCDRQPTSHPENLTAETICRLTGLLPLYPFEVPEGYVATGAMHIIVTGGAACKHYDTITIEEHEAQRAAEDAQAQIEAEAAEIKRQKDKSSKIKAFENLYMILSSALTLEPDMEKVDKLPSQNLPALIQQCRDNEQYRTGVIQILQAYAAFFAALHIAVPNSSDAIKDLAIFINSGAIYYDLRWWDDCVWHPELMEVPL